MASPQLVLGWLMGFLTSNSSMKWHQYIVWVFENDGESMGASICTFTLCTKKKHKYTTPDYYESTIWVLNLNYASFRFQVGWSKNIISPFQAMYTYSTVEGWYYIVLNSYKFRLSLFEAGANQPGHQLHAWPLPQFLFASQIYWINSLYLALICKI